jgi:hypothetical protein
MKHLNIAAKKMISLVLVLIVVASFGSTALALKNVCISKTFSYAAGPLKGTDTITYSINAKEKVVDLNARQKGGDVLGVYSITPEGVEIYRSSNTVYTYWTVDCKVPIFLFSIPLGHHEFSMKYTVDNTGKVTAKLNHMK